MWSEEIAELDRIELIMRGVYKVNSSTALKLGLRSMKDLKKSLTKAGRAPLPEGVITEQEHKMLQEEIENEESRIQEIIERDPGGLDLDDLTGGSGVHKEPNDSTPDARPHKATRKDTRQHRRKAGN